MSTQTSRSRFAQYRRELRQRRQGGKPPEGVTQLGRWFGLSGTGCSVVEADDPKGVFALVSEWQEFMQISATPVLEDDEAGEILAKLYG